MIVVEHKREFFCLSKYARELFSTEIDMYTHFEYSLNEDIHMIVRALELKEFVVLSKRA